MPFGWRSDAEVVDKEHRVRRMMQFLMRTRNESVVYFEQRLELEAVDAFIERMRTEKGLRVTYLHVALWALARTIHERPRLNRFTAGGRLYQRRGVWLTFSGKKQKTDAHPLVTVKQQFAEGLSIADVVRQTEIALAAARGQSESVSDKEMKVLLKMPAWLLSALIRLQRLLDAWGLLPSAFVEHDPLYTSVFLANLGSIDMDAGYHHLYEYGNCPIFMVMGRARNEVVAGEGGRIEVRRQITVRYSFDERVEDGLYCASALQRFKELFENPVD